MSKTKQREHLLPNSGPCKKAHRKVALHTHAQTTDRKVALHTHAQTTDRKVALHTQAQTTAEGAHLHATFMELWVALMSCFMLSHLSARGLCNVL